jgi:SAM-dependent methyltransferase
MIGSLRLGANVTAIDASQVGVVIAQERAAQNGLTIRVKALVMDTTQLTYADNSFDLVHGQGILHHVGLRTGLAEIRRVLRPGGTGVFLEPMGNVGWIKKAKAQLHARLQGKLDLTKMTADEENLRFHDILACSREFNYMRVYPYRVTYRVRRLFCPATLYPLLERFDHGLLKLAPFLRVFAGAVVIHVRK